MDVQELIEEAREAITVKRVFGEPYERNGLTVIPAAAVRGGGGGGGGEGADGKGSGGGFGVSAHPLGAFVIENGKVTWKPAIDVNRIILGGQIVALAAILTVRAIAKSRSRQAIDVGRIVKAIRKARRHRACASRGRA